ncbi:MAG: bifunctional [glutamine synthetase] adenylyltransferase/[glutamine synthetase]-adenylyl-L-tyrosine phosphorylase [Actinomycetota bacterium]
MPAEMELVEERGRRVRVSSRTLGELLDKDERARVVLAATSLPDRAAYARIIGDAWARGGIDELRLEKRRRLLQIAAWDMCADVDLEQVGAHLADLADACITHVLDVLDGTDRIAVIAMGKLGARELNYVSDIDLMFIANDDLERAARVIERLIDALGSFSPQGRAFVVDANLRPEGRSGALIRGLDGYLEYYRRWAKPWEFQALIKARLAAGDEALGEAFMEETRPLVFPGVVSAERVAAIRRIKQRVEEHSERSARPGRRRRSEDDIKLGPGGIRDIEFSVQLLQLVHGGSDATVRASATLPALDSLVNGGYVAEEDGAGLAVAYRWLRAVEHRIQLWQERRVRTLPMQPDAITRLARAMRFDDSPVASAAERFDAAHRGVLVDVRTRFDKLFYRPMIESLGEGTGPRLGAEALLERLRVLGFRDAERAARTLEGLVSGTSRRARLLRVLSPAVLRFLATSPLPDEGLVSFLRLAESLDMRLDTLGGLRDNPPALAFLARVLGSGRVPGELLRHVPEELGTIADPRRSTLVKERARVVREAQASLGWRSAEDRLDGLRRFKRRETLRITLADLGAEADVGAVGSALSDLADACLVAALAEVGFPFAVIALGKLGGRELNYASDIDVMFVHEGDQPAADKASEALVRAIGEVTPEGQAFQVDLGLRPEGKAGALVRSLDSYLEYYERWSKPWEHLALIKARPAAGDRDLGERLLAETRRYARPPEVSAATLAEIRHLKARMERERIARGTDPRRHIKLGPGGMSDVEFAAQLLQLRHAHEHASLRVTGTVAALDAAAEAGVLARDAAQRLTDAHRFLARLRNSLFLITGRPVDVLPEKPELLEALGVALGFGDQPRQELEERFLRLTRRARRVAEPLIYG